MIRQFLISYLLKKTFAKKEANQTVNQPFDKKSPSLLIVVKDNSEVAKLKHTATTLMGKDFGPIEMLQIVSDKFNHSPNQNKIFPGRLTIKAEAPIKDPKSTLPASFDIVLDMDNITDPIICHYLIKFYPQLMVRFNRDNEKFYNFILPNEKSDRNARLEQFFTTYQSLKK